MNTVYKINRLCNINTNNPTPCKFNMDIAINIVPVKKNKKFENFVLGINNFQQCYECFGCGCTLGYGFNVEKFVESIEIDVVPPTGIINSDEEGYGGILFARGSLGYKYGCTLTNSVGVIDSDYRGEIMARITNISKEQHIIKPGERFVQLVIVPVPETEYVEDELSDTERGVGGFGSTGRG